VRIWRTDLYSCLGSHALRTGLSKMLSHSSAVPKILLDTEQIPSLLQEIKDVAAAEGGIQLVRAKRNFDLNARGVCSYANPVENT
jgi:hypothetical protein